MAMFNEEEHHSIAKNRIENSCWKRKHVLILRWDIDGDKNDVNRAQHKDANTIEYPILVQLANPIGGRMSKVLVCLDHS